MWQHEVDHTRGDVFMAGDQFNGGEVINISYFAPAYYRAFGRVTGKTSDWNKVVEMTFRGKDEWKTPMDRVLNPWPVESVAGENRFRVHEGLGRIQFVTDRGTLTYGIGKTGPWALLRGEISPDVKDERNASYVVAWNNFLAGVPFRFKEYGAVAHYLGRAHRVYQNQSVEFDEVLVTYPPEGERSVCIKGRYGGKAVRR